MSDLFNKTRQFVDEKFKDPAQMHHFDRTVHWLLQLRPNADEALLIAAIGHDLERAFHGPDDSFNQGSIKFTDSETLKAHQDKSAELLAAFLKENNADVQLISRVKHLVSKHEVGGDEDQNLLMDTDSLSFLENNAPIFISRIDKLGFDKIKGKFDMMFNRISSPKVKDIGRPYYEKMLKDLETANKTYSRE
ncbi:MAG: DUF4202 family protein [Candidatus Doudnabacteria bacterium]|nr:DUF4202 family protein [Candidatus Doudnabacteria bacterium]